MTTPDRQGSPALILAPSGRDAPVAAALLREAGTDAIVCPDLAYLSWSLRDEICCAVVTEEALRDVDLTELAAWVATQPKWSDFPFIVLTQRGGASERHARAAVLIKTLGRKTSVEDKETKQISLLAGSDVPVQKVFVVNGQNFYYHNQQNPGSPLKDPVMVYYKFKNEEKAGLGMPMPAGNIRVYQKDSRGNLLFIGEDRIEHTPKDEMITIHIGNAFDVVSERKQTDYKRIDNHTWEMEFEITLRNHKDTPINVEVNEPIGGDWEMLNSTYKYTKTAAWAAQFQVPVSANGTSVLKYRIRARW